MMTLWIPYDPPNWNEYIRLERGSFYASNSLKQREKRLVAFYVKGRKWDGGYPLTIEFVFHFKDKRKDVDNSRIKGILDGLVACGCIKNDNLNCIRRIEIDSAIDEVEGIEINIREYNA